MPAIFGGLESQSRTTRPPFTPPDLREATMMPRSPHAMLVPLAAIVLLFMVAAPLVAADPGASTELPKGEVTKYSFDQSKIFPGTVRDYWVYVPQAIRSGQAGLRARQSGRRAVQRAGRFRSADPREGNAGDDRRVRRCTAASRPRRDQALDRFNRSYEYDGLGDNYARFLLDELLPEVETKTATDGRPIRLSHDGNDRSIGGCSSGAICAFTAAWERPDAFRRVFSAIGTYVGLRGGNVYPTLIRKYEPKPLRVFLQDGSADNEHLWRRLVDGQPGDGAGPGLRRLRSEPCLGRRRAQRQARHARSSPTPCAGCGKIGRRRSRPARARRNCRALLVPGEDWKLVAEGYKFTEGPAVNARGEVFFNDVPNSKTYKARARRPSRLCSSPTASKRRRPGLRSRRPALFASPAAPSKIVAYDAEGKSHRHRRRLSRQRPGRPPRRRHLRHESRLGRQRAEQGLVHQPAGREEGRRHRAEVLQRHHAFARPVAVVRRRQPHALGLQLPDAARRLAGEQAALLPSAHARHGRR